MVLDIQKRKTLSFVGRLQLKFWAPWNSKVCFVSSLLTNHCQLLNPLRPKPLSNFSAQIWCSFKQHGICLTVFNTYYKINRYITAFFKNDILARTYRNHSQQSRTLAFWYCTALTRSSRTLLTDFEDCFMIFFFFVGQFWNQMFRGRALDFWTVWPRYFSATDHQFLPSSVIYVF